jgi:glycosyltransferase involved in cell wall biosynthesis
MAEDMPVRVVYCEGNVDGTIGGSYYSLLYLVKGLDRRRYRPLVVFHSDNSLRARFEEAGAETVIWPRVPSLTFGTKLAPGWGPLGRLALIAQKAANFSRGFVWQAIKQAWFLRRSGARLLHLNNSIVLNQDWMLAARLAGIPCVSHERGINDHYPAAARYWAKRVDAIVCISEAVRDQLDAHGVNFGNLLTIHNGFDPAEARFEQEPAALRSGLGLAAEAPVLVMAGNLRAWKGQETVIRAIALVKQTHPSVRCLLIGAAAPEDRPFETAMRALAAELGVEDHVRFLGFRNHVADYMRLADVVLHASVLPEPFGRVALEAMACRKPVIGSNAGGMKEIIVDGETGLTFAPADADHLARAIAWMLDHPDEAARMGDRGYLRLVERFPLSANIRATESLYERVLGRTIGAPQAELTTK